MVVSVIRYLLDEGKTLQQALSAIAGAPMSLSEPPWAGLLWDSANHRMTVSSENQRVATRILLHGVGGRLAALKSTSDALIAEWAGIIDRPEDSVKLPVWKKKQ
jgi:hypothetical protein